jgi:maltose/moltooligosaccharide transporter
MALPPCGRQIQERGHGLQVETLPAEPTHAGDPAAPVARLPRSKIFWYGLANLGFGAFYAFNNAAMTVWLGRFTNNAALIGLLGGTHSFEGAVVQPVVGSISDRLRTSWGRRRPFLLLFVPLSALFLVLTPLAAHLPVGTRLGAIIASIFLFTMFFNVAQDPYNALMPDITPVWQRGRVTGVMMFLGLLGQGSILLLDLPLPWKFGLLAAAMLATTLATCATIREPRHAPVPESAPRKRDALRAALRGLRTLRQARKYLLVMFCYGAGVNAVLPLLARFVQNITGCTDHQAELTFMVLMLATAAAVLPFGWLTDRVGPKRVLLFGLSMIEVAALNGLWVTTLPQVVAIFVLAGLGNAATTATLNPLLYELVPAEEVGLYTGLATTAYSIAEPGFAVLTGSLVNGHGYRLVFVVCAAGVLAGVAILTFVRLRFAAAEIDARNRDREGPGSVDARG